MYFRTYRLPKTWLDKWLKGCVSEDPQRDNAAKVLKNCWSLNESTFTIFINHWEGVALEKVSFSDTQNAKSVFQHIDSR